MIPLKRVGGKAEKRSDTMMDQPSYDREVNAYLLKVDGILDSKGLLHDKGSAKLNKVQKEVDMTLDKLRAMQRESKLTRQGAGVMVNESLNRVSVISNQILDGVKVPRGSGFGALSNDSIFNTPAWKDAFSRVSLAISNFTNTYGTLISNMDQVSRTKIDQALASIIDDAKTCFNNDSSDASANRYLGKSLKALENLEKTAQSHQSVSAAAMLKLLVKEKDQERVRLLSEMKLVERNLTPQQISVVNDASRRVMEKLEDVLTDSSSYDAAIRNKKIQLVNSDLDIIRKTMQNYDFSQSLGKALPPPRSGGSRLGYLNKNKLSQPFRSALAGNLGEGTGFAFEEIDLTQSSPQKILATVKHNSELLKAQGGLTAEQLPMFIRQVNSLTKESFGGDTLAMKEAQRQYRLQASSSLSGVFTYDEPQESLINGVRLIGSVILYLTIPGLMWAAYTNYSERKNSPSAILARMREEE